jgi:hypothetical protein
MQFILDEARGNSAEEAWLYAEMVLNRQASARHFKRLL